MRANPTTLTSDQANDPELAARIFAFCNANGIGAASFTLGNYEGFRIKLHYPLSRSTCNIAEGYEDVLAMSQ